jgi:RNA polymerase sigma factor (sigma-70 family)
MIELTEQQIADAKNNDLGAVSAVVTATDERVVQVARKFATTSGRTDLDLADDLAQVGRIAVWQAIGRFEGASVAQFFTYIDRTLNTALSDERRALTRHGVAPQAAKDFEKAIIAAKGDPYDAERIVCTAEVMGARKMSPEMAYAARLSWQGIEYLDAPAPDADGGTVSRWDAVCDTVGLPAELMTPNDVRTARQRVVREHVRATLDKLSERMSGVLRRDYGIGDVPYYGDEVAAADDEMAANMGLTPYQVQQARTKGRARFAELYVKGAAA